MKADLRGAWLKLRWAKEHFHSFEQGADEFATQQSDSLVKEYDPKTGSWGLKFSEPPPSTLSLIAGDCVQNCRAALDFLAYELGRAYKMPRNHYESIKFPYSRRAAGKGGVENTILFKAIRRSRALQATLKRFQPYRNRPMKRYPLWMLQTLSNTDKHRRLNFSRVGLLEVVTRLPSDISGSSWPPVIWIERQRVSAAGYTDVAYPPQGLVSDTGDLSPPRNVNVQQGGRVRICFDPTVPGLFGRPVIPVLRGILTKVEEVLRQFEAEFP